jgi:hypothetical protein
MMASRTRLRNQYSGTGRKYNLQGVLLSSVANFQSQDKIVDFVAKGDGQNLDIRHLTLKGMVIREVATTGSISGRRWVNWMPDRCRNPEDSMFGHLIIPDQPSDAILAADLLARTNPNRSGISIPNFVWELREIPHMLKKEGDNLIQSHHKGNLAYEFGFKPLLSDLKKLINFSEAVTKRQKELETLFSKGLNRKRDLWSSSISGGPIDIIAQSGDKLTIHLAVHKTTVRKVWGFVRWFPTNPKLPKGDLRAWARKLEAGAVIDISTLWDGLPWSWLIDWCSNVGDILAANRNIIGASHSAIQLMTQTTTTADVTMDLPASTYSPGGWSEVTKKRRTVAYVPVDFQLPMLTQKQLSILGSIGVTRRVPRSL